MSEEKQHDKILEVDLNKEMRQDYINYAMSVIVSRALPDVRDGLKPVHRRILYAMAEEGYTADKPYRKCARVVGDTMGKYHPHGDSSIYEALVNLGQDFKTRYMLIDGHGNFGSIDGDSAAAMRYTECRLSKISEELLRDLNKNTVDMTGNFDNTLKEPTVLPARIPNLLANGTSGIAVGMATNIPPHNLGELIDASNLMIDNYIKGKETEVDDIIKIVKGPDFPTGATIIDGDELKKAYHTGRGVIKVRGVAEIEEVGGKDKIVITEIPYGVNKANLILKMAELVKDKKIDGISDIRDESNMKGIRIVIDIKRDGNANIILNKLYKLTPLQSSFGINMLAIVNDEPKTLSIKQMLHYYLKHQQEVETRRVKFDKEKAENRAHILEGYIIAADNIDEIVQIMKKAKDTNDAKATLMKKFKLSEIQAQAIADMRLKALTGLEREKVQQEHDELIKLIAELKALLEDDKKMFTLIKENLNKVKAKYGDERRTKFAYDVAEIEDEDLIKDEKCVVTMTYLGYIKRMPIDMYRAQQRGGRGVKGLEKREDDFIQNIFVCGSKNGLLFFTNKGRVFRIKAYEVPESSRTSRGMNIKSILPLAGDEKVSTVLALDNATDENFLMMVTKNGVIKRTQIDQYKNIRKTGIIGITLREDDELIRVCLTDGKQEVVLATKDGLGIRFKETEARAMGRTSSGVCGIKLHEGDEVVGMEIVNKDTKILVVSKRGLGKVFAQDGIGLQKRAGKGLKIHKVTPKTGNIAGIRTVTEEDEVMIITTEGIIIRIKIENISEMGRVTQGVKLINLEEHVEVVCVAKIDNNDDPDQIDEEEAVEEEPAKPAKKGRKTKKAEEQLELEESEEDDE